MQHTTLMQAKPSAPTSRGVDGDIVSPCSMVDREVANRVANDYVDASGGRVDGGYHRADGGCVVIGRVDGARAARGRADGDGGGGANRGQVVDHVDDREVVDLVEDDHVEDVRLHEASS